MTEQFAIWWKEVQQILGEQVWILQIFIVILATMITSYVAKRVLDRLEEKAGKTRTIWDDALIRSARRPARMLVWVIGLLWAGEIVYQVSQEPIFSFIDPARKVSTIVLVTWFLVSATKEIEAGFSDPGMVKSPMDKTTALALGNLVRVSLVITAVLVILQSLGFSISGVLAFGGIGGIAVGFAAKDLLANFFGGLMIFLDRPFAVGDWIKSPDKEIEGTVEHIGWRLTIIRTFDKRPLYVPNSVFSSISVENPSRMTNRRIYETIGVRYDDVGVMVGIIEDVQAMLQQHDAIDTRQTMIVNFNAFNASSVDFFVYTFTKTTDWIEYHGIKQDVLLKIHQIIDNHGAEIAFPTTTLHLASTPELAGLASESQS
ncbi:mechanosensitive ion channel family protein [Gynuella sp.]|uniref:mechanosensitive ion channel family protein n=1 Tax=Gynuella sp. TaxID=2969146 RepID=UPI003D0EAD89